MSTKLSLAFLLAVGCGTSIHATTINPSPHPMTPRPPATVEMFTSGAPPRPHVDVAFLEAEESSGLSLDRTPQMLDKLRARGADMGCDAIVIGGMSSRDPGVGDAESWLVENPKGRKGIYATCIVYTAPPMPPIIVQPVIAGAPAAPAPAAPAAQAPAPAAPAVAPAPAAVAPAPVAPAPAAIAPAPH